MKIFKKIVGLFIIIMFIVNMVPISALNTPDKVAQEIYEEEMLRPLNDTNTSNVLVKHLQEKIPDLSNALVLKFYQDGLMNQSAWKNVLKDQNPGEFYCDYLANSDTKYTFLGTEMTAREAYDRIPAINNSIKNLNTFEDRLVKMTPNQRLNFIRYEYHNDVDLEKLFKSWDTDVHKINYVLSKAELNTEVFDEKYMPKNKLDKPGWRHYAFVVNESICNYTRNIYNLGLNYKEDYPDGSPNDTVLHTSEIVSNIHALNDSANKINDKRYNYYKWNLGLKVTGFFLVGLGAGLMGTSSVKAIKTKFCNGNGKQVILPDGDGNMVLLDENGKPKSLDVPDTQSIPETPQQSKIRDDCTLALDSREANTELTSNILESEFGGAPLGDVLMQQGEVFIDATGEHLSMLDAVRQDVPKGGLSCRILVESTSGQYYYRDVLLTRSIAPGYLNPIKIIDQSGITFICVTTSTGNMFIPTGYQGTYKWQTTFRTHNVRKSVVSPTQLLNLSDDKKCDFISFKDKAATMKENETTIVRNNGEYILFNKYGVDNLLEDTGFKTTDLYNKTGELTTDAPFDNNIFYGSDVANFEDKFITRASDLWVTIGSIGGGTVAGIVIDTYLPTILQKICNTVPGLNVAFIITGAIVSVIGGLIVYIANIINDIIDAMTFAITSIKNLIIQNVHCYKYIYAPLI